MFPRQLIERKRIQVQPNLYNSFHISVEKGKEDSIYFTKQTSKYFSVMINFVQPIKARLVSFLSHKKHSNNGHSRLCLGSRRAKKEINLPYMLWCYKNSITLALI